MLNPDDSDDEARVPPYIIHLFIITVTQWDFYIGQPQTK